MHKVLLINTINDFYVNNIFMHFLFWQKKIYAFFKNRMIFCCLFKNVTALPFLK